ncbi:MAG: hypothetical protein ABWW69_04940 [Pyrodictiaceae archaeon]
MSKKARLPERFIKDFFEERARLVKEMLSRKGIEGLEVELLRAATLLAPMVATCGPAGPNVAPFMVTFLVKDDYLKDTIEEMKRIIVRYWGKKHEAFQATAEFLLRRIYNPSYIDLTRLVTHIMSKGHTWVNIKTTGKATLGILIPPDKGAYEVRARARIIEDGPIYKYTNLLHDLIHAMPHGERSHPWYPVILFEIEEIYDNSYQALGKRIYP